MNGLPVLSVLSLSIYTQCWNRPSYSEPMSYPPMLSVCIHPKLPSRCVSTDGAGRLLFNFCYIWQYNSQSIFIQIWRIVSMQSYIAFLLFFFGWVGWGGVWIWWNRIHWWTIEYAGLSYDGHVDLDPLVGTLLTDGVDGAWSLLFSSDGRYMYIFFLHFGVNSMECTCFQSS